MAHVVGLLNTVWMISKLSSLNDVEANQPEVLPQGRLRIDTTSWHPYQAKDEA